MKANRLPQNPISDIVGAFSGYSPSLDSWIQSMEVLFLRKLLSSSCSSDVGDDEIDHISTAIVTAAGVGGGSGTSSIIAAVTTSPTILATHVAHTNDSYGHSSHE